MNDPMVDVQVSCVVGVDNDRAKLLDNLLDGFDHIQQINTVQSIVGQSQKPGRGGSEYNSGIPGGILQGIDRFFVGRCIAINFSRRRTLSDDDDMHPVPVGDMPGRGAAASQNLVVRVGGNDQYNIHGLSAFRPKIAITCFSTTNLPLSRKCLSMSPATPASAASL